MGWFSLPSVPKLHGLRCSEPHFPATTHNLNCNTVISVAVIANGSVGWFSQTKSEGGEVLGCTAGVEFEVAGLVGASPSWSRGKTGVGKVSGAVDRGACWVDTVDDWGAGDGDLLHAGVITVNSKNHVP